MKAKTNATAKQNAEVFNRGQVKWNTVDEILSTALVTEDKGQYALQKGITLTIFFTDKDYDYGSLNFFGCSIEVTFRNGKNGMFLSFPSVKSTKGGYKDLVTCYDKDFHKLIKELLGKIYEC